MFFASLLFLIASAAGITLTYLFDDRGPAAWRLCAGPVIGLAGLAFIGFILASLLGLTPLALILTGILSAISLLLLGRTAIKAAVRSDAAALVKTIGMVVSRPRRATIAHAVFGFSILLTLFLLFDQVLFYREDGLYTGLSNNYGDLPFHLNVISRFVYGGNFPPEDPTFAGVRFAYPFLSDFLAAMFVRAGAGLRGAMFLMNFPLGVALAGLFHRLSLEITRDRLAAMLSVLLVFFSGGLGWLLIFPEARETEIGLLGLLKRLPHDYTTFGSGYRWGNVLTSLLIPQRSILLGMPLAIIIFTIWWRRFVSTAEGGSESSGRQLEGTDRSMLAAGALAGLLPLIHAHTFGVVIGMAVCFALLSRRWRAWWPFFATASVIAAPQLIWVMHGSVVRPQSFFEWHPGWDSNHGNIFWFWLKNTGPLIPLLAAAILWRIRRPAARTFVVAYLPFTLCFIVPNLLKLSPWIWDNIKILIYWYLASAPFVALLLAKWWRGGEAARAAAVVAFASLTLAGSFDIWRCLSGASQVRVFDKDAMAIAEILKAQTAPRSVVLHAPTSNSPVFLTGRRSLMGYPGHIWTHGIDYGDRFEEIRRIYTGEPGADEMMAQLGVDYAIVSPQERALTTVNDAFFDRFPKIGQAGEYSLYRISGP